MKIKRLPIHFGFTLVELLVTISIMAVIFSVGVSRYLDFNRSRQVAESTKTLRNDLNFIRNKALSGEKVSGCSVGFDGWYLRLAAHTYTFGCRCNGDFDQKTVSVGSVTLSPVAAEVLFRPLTLGVPAAANFTLILNNYTETISISTRGEIN